MLVAVITTKLLSLTQPDEKWKRSGKLLRFIIILIMQGSYAECSDLYDQRTRFRCLACCSTSKHWKHPSLEHARRVLGRLSSTNTIPMLRYSLNIINWYTNLDSSSSISPDYRTYNLEQYYYNSPILLKLK